MVLPPRPPVEETGVSEKPEKTTAKKAFQCVQFLVRDFALGICLLAAIYCLLAWNWFIMKEIY